MHPEEVPPIVARFELNGTGCFAGKGTTLLINQANNLSPRPKFTGVSFHVGSNTLRESASGEDRSKMVMSLLTSYEQHLDAAAVVLNKMIQAGHAPEFVDLGEGWLGANDLGHRMLSTELQARIAAFQAKLPKGISVNKENRAFVYAIPNNIP